MLLKDIQNQKEFVFEFIENLGKQTNKINDLDFNAKEFTHFEKVEAVKNCCTILVDNEKVHSEDYMGFIFEDNTCLLYSKKLENYIVLNEPWFEYKNEKFSATTKQTPSGKQPGDKD